MEAVPNWLNYGAFGLLAIVLVIGGKFIHDQWRETTKTLADAANFSRSIAEKSLARAEKIQDSFEAVVKENTTTQAVAVNLMTEVIREIRASEEKSREEHEKTSDLLKRLLEK